MDCAHSPELEYKLLPVLRRNTRCNQQSWPWKTVPSSKAGALVRHLRTRGVMRGVLSSIESDANKLIQKAKQIPTMSGLDLASRVSTTVPYEWDKPVEPCSPSDLIARPAEPRFHVVAYDFGI